MTGQLEVLVRERARSFEEDEDEAVGLVPRVSDRDGEERPIPGAACELVPVGFEPVVVCDVTGCEHAAIRGGAREHDCGAGQPLAQHLGQRRRDLGRAGQLERRATRHQHSRERASKRFVRRVRNRFERRRQR